MRRLAVALACAGAALSGAPASAAAPAYVSTVNSLYVPGDVTVVQGGTLTLVNGENIAHDVVSSDVEDGSPLFQSSVVLGVGATAEVRRVPTLTPGIYPFFCSVHEYMRGTLTVV